MDKLSLLAHVLRRLLAACRAMRIAPAASMSNADIAANAHGISYAILATCWQRKTGVPSWASVYRQWQSQLSGAGGPTLCGAFDPADRLELLTDNAAAFEKRFELYQNAKQSIDISTFYIQADEVSRRTARSLADCARRGVRVRIVADRGVTMRKVFENPQVFDLIRFLRDAGVDYRLFKDPGRPYDACHHKLLIVDGATLITGSRNYADHYAGNEWRDIDLLLTGPSVASVQHFYEQTFANAPIIHDRGLQDNIFRAATPADISSNAFFIYLLECIRACRNTLDIENAYYFNHPVLHHELAEACGRGVRVRLFTNSAESNDLDIMNYRLYAGFPDLIDAGVLLYLRRGIGRTLHCKYFVADGEWIGFGSSNLDFFSPRFCLELGIQVRDPHFGELLTAWFEQGIAEAELMNDSAAAETVLEKQTVARIFDRWLPDMQ
ncbi:MAG: phospholipase D-like domain-containing protein [Methylobacter sp.]